MTLEVALAIVLLASSTLMIRSLAKLLSVETGFSTQNILTLRLTVPPGTVPRDSLPGFYTQLLERVRAVPGVRSVAISDCPPLNAGCNGTLMEWVSTCTCASAQATNSPSRQIHWVAVSGGIVPL